MKKFLIVLAALIAAGSAKANATPVTLTFSGLQDEEAILNYYNGGSGGDGSTGGTNYGIAFSANSLAVKSVLNGGSGNFSNVPAPATNTIAFFLNGVGDVMNVAAGFNTGFSFYYAAAAGIPGSVSVYSGVNGTGTLLDTLSLGANGSYCGVEAYSCWSEEGVGFSGLAKSVVFGGSANYIGFADVTLGASSVPTGPTVPPAVPEPSSLVLLGSGVLAMAGLVRRKLAV